MAQQTLNNLESGLLARTKINENFTEAYKSFQDGGEIFVSTTGNDSNDGLLVSTPLLTIQAAFDLLSSTYGPVLKGEWHITLAAGTYTEGASETALRSQDRIIIRGPSVGGSPNVPTAIIDGAISAKIAALIFSDHMFIKIEDVKVANWSGTAQSGVLANYFCDIWTVNYHADGCSFAGMGISQSRLSLAGGILNANRYGVRAYASSSIATSYTGLKTDITNSTESGILMRDGSQGVDVGSLIDNSTVANVALLNFSRLKLDAATVISNSNIGIQSQINSTYYLNGATLSTNTTDEVQRSWSMDFDSIAEQVFDKANHRFHFGAIKTPAVAFQFINDTTGALTSSAGQFVFESTTGPALQLLSDGVANYGLICSKPGTAAFASILYVNSNHTWRFTNNSIETMRLNDDPGAGTASMFLLVNDGGATTLRQVNVGAADSGGTGQRLLTVAN